MDVDQVHLTGEFRQKGRQDVFLVTPDQPVSPLLFSESRAILQATLTVQCRFIHGLNRLKRERHPHGREAPAGGVVLPFPNEFCACGSALDVRRRTPPRRILRLLAPLVHYSANPPLANLTYGCAPTASQRAASTPHHRPRGVAGHILISVRKTAPLKMPQSHGMLRDTAQWGAAQGDGESCKFWRAAFRPNCTHSRNPA